MLDYLRSNFEYKDGNLYRTTCKGGEKIGNIAGWVTKCNGREYKKMNVNKKSIYVHQAIFLIHHGYLPKYIDHIDGNSLNNKIDNLRPATQSQNGGNSKLKRNNTSGNKGVIFRKDTNKWAAQIMVNRKHISLGSFQIKDDAIKAYENGALKYFGEFAKPDSRQQANARLEGRVTV